MVLAHLTSNLLNEEKQLTGRCFVLIVFQKQSSHDCFSKCYAWKFDYVSEVHSKSKSWKCQHRDKSLRVALLPTFW